ncbi:hypothetical protein HF673_09320 [Acidithiobacillus thiooxidans]|jgi:hypothetical protein|uniref:hypothetical protein n=1 Tax=Acidithiobacillus TaxID=119977 RepID=UPI0004E1E2F0|nr:MULTISPECIES: hypothetical protein [Acidithiobacillus]MBU2835959.1 hypothetical protein [Acidithiobacillus thiooxidans]MDA8177439.1 hypothetical protein [Acidithiobacillus sp.]
MKRFVSEDMPIYEIMKETGADEDLAATAVHEAGHLLAAIRLKLYPGTTTIIPNEEEGTAGHSCHDIVEFPADATDEDIIASGMAQKLGIHSMAGAAALQLMGISEKDSLLGADSDIEAAMRLLGGLGAEFYLDKALSLFHQENNPAALRLLAVQLLLHKTIGAGYAEQIVDVADDEATMAEIDEAIAIQGKGFILE